MNLQIVTKTLLAKRWVAASWAPIPLRLIVGFGFVAHGYAKLVKGPYVFVGILHALGVETDLLYLACLAALVVGGSGPWAIDGIIANRWRRWSNSQ